LLPVGILIGVEPGSAHAGVSFGDLTGTYREFVRMLFQDDELVPDLLAGDVRANLLMLMKDVAEQWNDRFAVDMIRGGGG
jgi:hypothetical protein